LLKLYLLQVQTFLTLLQQKGNLLSEYHYALYNVETIFTNEEINTIKNSFYDEQKYESSFLLLNNIIIASVGGYSFKKISNYKKEGENHWIKFRLDLEEYPYSEKEILNILTSYKENCNNIKIEQKSNSNEILLDK